MTINWEIVLNICKLLTGIVAGAYILKFLYRTLKNLYRWITSIVRLFKRMREIEVEIERLKKGTERVAKLLETRPSEESNSKNTD